LIGKRLEEVEVPAIDQRHVHRRPGKLADSLKAGEATADDDDAVARAPGHARRWNRRFLPLGYGAHRHCLTLPAIGAWVLMV
jgi:hypothetical protein